MQTGSVVRHKFIQHKIGIIIGIVITQCGQCFVCVVWNDIPKYCALEEVEILYEDR